MTTMFAFLLSFMLFVISIMIAYGYSPTIKLPSNSVQNLRSILCLFVNTCFAMLISWIFWGIICGFYFLFGVKLPDPVYMYIFIGTATIATGIIVNYKNILLPNSNSVLRVQNNLNPIRIELVRGQNPVDVAFKYIGGLYGIKFFFAKTIGNEINTEQEKSIDFTIFVTTKDDVITCIVRLMYKPDINLTDVYGSRGEDEESRKKNVEDELDGTMKAQVEQLLSNANFSEILAVFTRVNTYLSRLFTTGMQGLERATGVAITRVMIIGLDQSEDAEQAHITAGQMKKLIEAADSAVRNDSSPEGQKITFAQALNRAIAMAGEGEYSLRQYEGFENLRGSVMLGAGFDGGGSQQSDKKKRGRRRNRKSSGNNNSNKKGDES